jgi:inhibitor of cysteine peptidase
MGRRICFFGLLVLLLTACGGAAPVNHEFTVEQHATTQTVTVGDTVTVSLAGNPTTGYSWVQLSGDAAVLAPTAAEPAYSSEAASDMVGVGGTFTFSWTAQAVGTTTIELGYRRPWETDVAPVETFTLTVEVQ